MDNKDFIKQAEKIHDIHIKQEISADEEIAKKRIDRYFKGELKLTWKSIIYEINKLNELERNKYFTLLVVQQACKAKEQVFEEIKKMSMLKFMKFRKEL